jgi:hypothetical protein
MADLAVTIGADTTELEKKVKEAGKTIKNGLTQGGAGGVGGVGKAMDFASNLLAGNVGTAIGSLFGPVGQAVGQFVDQLAAKAKELMDQAIQLRNLSYQTNLSPQQLQGLENVAKATGLSVGKLADSISEYNRRLGYAQMHGGEMNVLLNKMGVSFDQIKNRTFTYFDAINALAKAQAAGTDEATLNHYANVMLGSSYKELLPLIKTGSENLRVYSESIYKTSQESLDALTEAGDAWNSFTESVKNMAMEALGAVLQMFSDTPATIANEIQRRAAGTNDLQNPEKILKDMSVEMGAMDPKKKKEMLQNAVAIMGSDNAYGNQLGVAQQKAFLDVIEKMFPGAKSGNKLNPFGAEQAQGASQMQQMGGGDIFGAISFNPFDRTATATEASAESLKAIEAKMDEGGVDNIGIGNDPERSR